MPVRLLTWDEAAAFLHLDAGELRQMAVCGEIPCVQSGPRMAFDREELDNWYTDRLIRGLAGRQKAGNPPPANAAPTLSALCREETMATALPGKTRDAILRALTALCENSGLLYDPREFYEELKKREEVAPTAMNGGIALCHPENRDEFLCEAPFIAVAHSERPIFFGAPNGEATDLFFVIAGPDDDLHLHIIARLCELLTATDIASRLRTAETPAEMLEAMKETENSLR